MVDKNTEDKKKKVPFSDSSEIFKSIFKEATSEIRRETGKVAEKPGLKAKPKPDVKPKPEGKPQAPAKLEMELEPVPEPKAEPEKKFGRPEAKPRVQAPMLKPRQEPIPMAASGRPSPDENETETGLLSTKPLMRRRIEEQEAKEEPVGKAKGPKPSKQEGRGSPVLRIILLILLLAVGVGGASVYLGIIDVNDYMGLQEPATKPVPKVAVVKPSPAQPSAEPADEPKPSAPSQTVQPPQALPKPVEPAPVKEAPAPAPKPEAPAEPSQTASPPVAPPPAASAPQPPPDAQVKPVSPPAPPAVAKVETPPSPPQPQAKAEPAPAPARPSTVARKPETPAPSPQPKQASAAKAVPPAAGTGVGYPYSVYLESLQNADNLKRTVQTYESQGLSIYWAKVSLGAKGTWYRLFTGYFRSAQEAEAFIQQKRIKDGEVKQTRYANLIGTFGTRQAGEERVLALANMGLSAYSIQGADGQVRVYSGAHMNREGAETNQAELNSRGIKSEVVER